MKAKEDKKRKQKKYIIFFIIIIIVLFFLLIKFLLFSCPDTYYETPIATLNKTISNKEEALDVLRDYLLITDLNPNDVLQTNIRFTTGNNILVWELKSRGIAIDKKSNIYQKIKCI